MALMDVFTGGPAKEAANLARIATAQGKKENIGTIDTGLNSSLANLATGYNTGTGAVNQGYQDATTALDGSRGYLDQSVNNFGALAGKYGGASTMALNALGVNGQPGIDSARSSFQAGPAYNFNMEQGLEAINRRRAAGGMLDSGNADRDAQTFGAGLASNEHQNWMNQLLGFTNPEVAATAGQGTALQGQANLGTQQAGLATQRGGMLADLAQRYGTGQAGLNTGAANAKVGNTNMATNANINSFNKEAEAELAGSANMWKFGMAGAQALAGMPGIGSLGSLAGQAGGYAQYGTNPFNGQGGTNPYYG
jgi:hypothetical protein